MTGARPATGRLVRDHDVSGVSGTGTVAEVCVWPDGTAAIRWHGDYPTTVHHDRGRESIDHIHSHGGATRIVWDNPQSAPPDLRAVQGRLTNVLQGELEGWPDQIRWEDVWALVRDVQPLIDEIAALREQVTTLTRERDLAIAHDRQPYPTADAYGRAVAALEKQRARASALDDALAEFSEQLRQEQLRHQLAEREAAGLRTEVDRLQGLAFLLGPSRMVLDRAAVLLGEHGAGAEAADMAQRIVDQIGDPVTDEPAWAALPCEQPEDITGAACGRCRSCAARARAALRPNVEPADDEDTGVRGEAATRRAQQASLETELGHLRAVVAEVRHLADAAHVATEATELDRVGGGVRTIPATWTLDPDAVRAALDAATSPDGDR